MTFKLRVLPMNSADGSSHTAAEKSSADFILIAHRGLRSHFPENTIAAFNGALAHGCCHFETDAQLTSDGTCVIFHDDTLDRTTNGTGKLAEVRFAAEASTCCQPLPSMQLYMDRSLGTVDLRVASISVALDECTEIPVLRSWNNEYAAPTP